MNIYQDRPGTIRIAGGTNPRKAAACAFQIFIDRRIKGVELICVGGNAQQQAVKTLVSLRRRVRRQFPGMDLAAFPMNVSVNTTDARDIVRTKTATLWRVVMLPLDSVADIANDFSDYEGS